MDKSLIAPRLDPAVPRGFLLSWMYGFVATGKTAGRVHLACLDVVDVGSSCLSSKLLVDWEDITYKNIISHQGLPEEHEKEMSTIPPKPKTQHCKIAKTDAHNLWVRLKGYEAAIVRE